MAHTSKSGGDSDVPIDWTGAATLALGTLGFLLFLEFGGRSGFTAPVPLFLAVARWWALAYFFGLSVGSSIRCFVSTISNCATSPGRSSVNLSVNLPTWVVSHRPDFVGELVWLLGGSYRSHFALQARILQPDVSTRWTSIREIWRTLLLADRLDSWCFRWLHGSAARNLKT